MFDTEKRMTGASTLFVANVPPQSGEEGPTIRRAEMSRKTWRRFQSSRKGGVVSKFPPPSFITNPPSPLAHRFQTAAIT